MKDGQLHIMYDQPYVKHTWQAGDVITAELLNNIEDGIEAANNAEIPLPNITMIWEGVNLIGALTCSTNPCVKFENGIMVGDSPLNTTIKYIPYYNDGDYIFSFLLKSDTDALNIVINDSVISYNSASHLYDALITLPDYLTDINITITDK